MPPKMEKENNHWLASCNQIRLFMTRKSPTKLVHRLAHDHLHQDGRWCGGVPKDSAVLLIPHAPYDEDDLRVEDPSPLGDSWTLPSYQQTTTQWIMSPQWGQWGTGSEHNEAKPKPSLLAIDATQKMSRNSGSWKQRAHGLFATQTVTLKMLQGPETTM
jgi:hypothetical protein